MNIKEIEKVSKLVEKIKVLDVEIKDINEMALLIANVGNQSFEHEFILKIKDLTKKEKEGTKKSILDEDGSLINLNSEDNKPDSTFPWSSIIIHTTGKENKKEIKYDYEINQKQSVNTLLRILGILMDEKQETKNKLIKQLKKFNIEL
jgi:hypothetical protein